MATISFIEVSGFVQILYNTLTGEASFACSSPRKNYRGKKKNYLAQVNNACLFRIRVHRFFFFFFAFAISLLERERRKM